MSENLIGVIGIVVLLILLFLRMHVGLAMFAVGFIGCLTMMSLDAAGIILGNTLFKTVTSLSFSAFPMFVLMGELAANSGISERLFYTAHKWVGNYKGGLAMATIIGCAGFGAVCGSSGATSITMAKVAYPQMEKYNYKPELSSGCIALGGGLGILIPPSLVLILYAVLTEGNITRLFMAGIVPGIIEAFLFLAVIFIWTKVDPLAGPAETSRVSLKEKLVSLQGVIEVVFLFIFLLGGLFWGFFTPTEAGAIGAVCTLLVTMARRIITRKQFMNSLLGTVNTSGMVFLLFVGAMVFTTFLGVSQLPEALSSFIVNLNLPPLLVMTVIILTYLILGCVMDTAAMIILTVPIFYPVVTSIGYSPIWFGIIIIIVAEAAMITPPFGVNVWIIGGMLKHIRMQKIFKGSLIFLSGLIVLLVLLLVFPQIVTFLPDLAR